MKRDEINIDLILKQYLPRAPQEEVDAAGDTVLKRIREMRYQAEAPAAVEPVTAAEAKGRAQGAAYGEDLLDLHVGTLLAVEALQGYGHPVSITLKMEEILQERVWATAVFINLLLFEKMGLVSSSPIDPEKLGELDERYFAITESGREALKKALAKRQDAVVRPRRPRFA